MTRATCLLSILVAGLLAVTACTESDGSSTATLTATAGANPVGEESSPMAPNGDNRAAAVPGKPELGNCWAIPAGKVLDPDYWVDDSPTVPCSEPHTTQTASVLSLNEPTIEQATERAQGCGYQARLFLGVNRTYWVPYGFVMFLPSDQQIADGASWARCDVYFPARWDFGTVRSTSTSAINIAIDPPDEFWACLDQDPSKRDQPFVPCDQPHQYEQTGDLAILDGLAGVGQYPSPAELQAAAQEQCTPADTDQGAGPTSATAAWTPRSSLRESTEIAGACFIFNGTGNPPGPRS